MDFNKFVESELNKKLDEETTKIKIKYQTFLNSLLKQNLPLEICNLIYDKTISFRQSSVCKKGKMFDDVIENLLKSNDIKFYSQVFIKFNDKEAYVSEKPTNTKVDFVINLNNGDIKNKNIKDLIILSCKFSCRERYKEDDWTLKFQPKKYFLLVYSKDYPKKFLNNDKRNLITLYDEKYNFKYLIQELKQKQLKNNINFIDLCCGIGSFHYSMKKSNIKSNCILACDILKSARNTYKENYNVEPLNDLQDIDYSKYEADIVFSGNPCQSFSNIGKRKGLEDSRGNLFLWIIENILGLKKYPCFVFENVYNLLKIEEGKIFELIKTKIESYNYLVWYKILLASDYGIPQNRKRIFIICVKKGYKNIDNVEFVENIFQEVKNKYYNKNVKLNDFLKVDEEFKFIKDIAFTIRCGGRKSPINSKQNWDGYYLENKEKEIKEYRLTTSDMQILQGFDKTFKLVGTETEKQKLLGNTIPTNLSLLICEVVNKILS